MRCGKYQHDYEQDRKRGKWFTLDWIITEYRAIGEQGHFSRRPYRLHWKGHTQIVNSLSWTNVYRVRSIFTSRSRSLSLFMAICTHSKQRLKSVCGLTARHRMEPNDLGFIGLFATFDSCAGENGCDSGDLSWARLECPCA